MSRSKINNTTRLFVRVVGITLLVFIGVLLYERYARKNDSTSIEGLRELSGDFKSHGIDISRYQGEINWDVFFKDADSTISFVYCKATEGVSHVDDQWKRNQEMLRKNNKLFGAYHFFLPRIDAKTQAEHFLNNYDAEQNELPPVLDVESEGISDKDLISNMDIWLKEVELHSGKRPIIYTSYHFYSTKFKNQFLDYKFWIANYNNIPTRIKDERIIHWQYSDNGRIPGINGPVDLNCSKIDFN